MSTYDMIIEKGIEREKIEVILRGFNNGATLEFLSKITDTSIAQIKKNSFRQQSILNFEFTHFQ